MCFHFINQYGNSKAVPSMLLSTSHGGMTAKGTFWLFFAITAMGGVWVWFTIPETAGLSLEATDRLFSLPWYKIGTQGRKNADFEVQVERERQLVEKPGAAEVEVIESDKRV
jgi:hypothetical protein